jgi:hypothetical protein
MRWDLLAALLAIFLAALALIGLFRLRRGTLDMPTNEKPVVNVVNGAVSVDPDPLRFRRDRGAVVIVWEIASSEPWRFVEGKGIDVKDPGGEFEDARVIADGRKFQIKNKNSIRRTYKYAITVRNTATGQTVTLDPAIINME